MPPPRLTPGPQYAAYLQPILGYVASDNLTIPNRTTTRINYWQLDGPSKGFGRRMERYSVLSGLRSKQARNWPRERATTHKRGSWQKKMSTAGSVGGQSGSPTRSAGTYEGRQILLLQIRVTGHLAFAGHVYAHFWPGNNWKFGDDEAMMRGLAKLFQINIKKAIAKQTACGGIKMNWWMNSERCCFGCVGVFIGWRFNAIHSMALSNVS